MRCLFSSSQSKHLRRERRGLRKYSRRFVVKDDVVMMSFLQQTDLIGFMSQATSFLMYCVPRPLQYHMRFLLTSTVQSREHFHRFKVSLCVCVLLCVYSSCSADDFYIHCIVVLGSAPLLSVLYIGQAPVVPRDRCPLSSLAKVFLFNSFSNGTRVLPVSSADAALHRQAPPTQPRRRGNRSGRPHRRSGGR